MNTKDKNKKEFSLEEFKLDPVSSLDSTRSNLIVEEGDKNVQTIDSQLQSDSKDDAEQISEAETLAEADETSALEDPIFKELSAPKLPELKKENRARLQMQSPNRIHFYWSIKNNPFQTLKRVFGSQTNYMLVAKLVNQTSDREEFFPVEAEGSAWFDTDANSTYQAELGFYAPNRPFVRLMFSNAIETPRKNPSPYRDYSPNFTVSADQFAEVLDVSGFEQDAFEVALAGDDIESADSATQTAFAQITAAPPSDFDANQSSEMRFVLLALASGYSVENLREHISPSLFAVLQGNREKFDAERALAALQENFGVLTADETGELEEESFGATVFGASLINFPRFSRRKTLSKFTPISSLPAKYF